MGKTGGEARSEGKVHSSVYDVMFEMPMKHQEEQLNRGLTV